MTKEQREAAIKTLNRLIDVIEDDQAYSQMSREMYEDGYRRIDAYKCAIAALETQPVESPEPVSSEHCNSCRHADGNGPDYYCMEHYHHMDGEEYCSRYKKEDEE